MDILTHYHGTDVVEFGINTRKYLFSKAPHQSFMLFQGLRSSLNKQGASEYAEEWQREHCVLLNGEPITPKSTKLFVISPEYDFEEDAKLKSTSAIHLYLKHQLKDIEYSEEFNTMSILLSDLAEQIESKVSMNNNGLDLSVDIEPLTLKSLLKMLKVGLVADDLSASACDLTYEAFLTFQIDLMERIAQSNPERTYIGWVIAPYVSENLKNRIQKLILTNLKLLVPTPPIAVDNLEDAVLLDPEVIDLADETQIYERLTLRLPEANTIEDTLAFINNHLKNGKGQSIPSLEAFL